MVPKVVVIYRFNCNDFKLQNCLTGLTPYKALRSLKGREEVKEENSSGWLLKRFQRSNMSINSKLTIA